MRYQAVDDTGSDTRRSVSPIQSQLCGVSSLLPEKTGSPLQYTAACRPTAVPQQLVSGEQLPAVLSREPRLPTASQQLPRRQAEHPSAYRASRARGWGRGGGPPLVPRPTLDVLFGTAKFREI